MATEPDACSGRHQHVLVILAGIAIAASALRTPWRMLTTLERVWAALALCLRAKAESRVGVAS